MRMPTFLPRTDMQEAAGLEDAVDGAVVQQDPGAFVGLRLADADERFGSFRTKGLAVEFKVCERLPGMPVPAFVQGLCRRDPRTSRGRQEQEGENESFHISKGAFSDVVLQN